MREFPNYLMNQESSTITASYQAAINNIEQKEETTIEKRWTVEKQTFKPTVLPPVLQQQITKDTVDYALIKKRLLPSKEAYILFDVNNRLLHHELEEMANTVEKVEVKTSVSNVKQEQAAPYKGVKRGLHRTMDGIFEQETKPTQYFKSQR